MVGDLVQLYSGMEIPADGIITESNFLRINEEKNFDFFLDSNYNKKSIDNCLEIKNEILAKKKNKELTNIPSPFILAGSLVLEGCLY